MIAYLLLALGVTTGLGALFLLLRLMSYTVRGVIVGLGSIVVFLLSFTVLGLTAWWAWSTVIPLVIQ